MTDLCDFSCIASTCPTPNRCAGSKGIPHDGCPYLAAPIDDHGAWFCNKCGRTGGAEQYDSTSTPQNPNPSDASVTPNLARSDVTPRFKQPTPVKAKWRKPLPWTSARRASTAAERARVRELVFERDRWTCRLEGYGPCAGGPTFHHRRKASDLGAYSVDNGVLLCVFHNRELEHDADLAVIGRGLRLVVRRGDPEWAALGS